MLTKSNVILKRVFDVVLSIVLCFLFFIPIVLILIIVFIDLKRSCIYIQERIGQNGKVFNIYKIRTLKGEQHNIGELNNYTTKFSSFLRGCKLDELPQIFNVLKGDMSFVGPRPDVAGFADMLEGEERIILKIKPGITGPATIKYKDEDKILLEQKNPDQYNRMIIWKDKVRLNMDYIKNWSFFLDLKYMVKSVFTR